MSAQDGAVGLVGWRPTAGRVCRRFSPDDDAQITDLRVRGDSIGVIATKTGRAKSSVQKRLDALAERDEAND